MSLHGKGIFGQSPASIKGSQRVTCPHCEKVFVPTSPASGHMLVNGKVICPKHCSQCGGLNWSRDVIGQCPDCGYDCIDG